MKPVKFKQCNSLIGEAQAEYDNIPAYRGDEKNGPLLICFELSEEEKKQVKETGCIWLMQYTYGQPMAPIAPTLLEKDNMPTKKDVEKTATTLDQKKDQLDTLEGKNRCRLRSIHKKTGRNQKCPCGSGKKYNNCHLGANKPPNSNR